jgi:hypothetical protein
LPNEKVSFIWQVSGIFIMSRTKFTTTEKLATILGLAKTNLARAKFLKEYSVSWVAFTSC